MCNLGCLPVTGEGLPTYTAPVASNGVSDYTFPTSGAYSVRLTATDANRDQAVDTFNVDVADVPPTPALNPTPGRPVRRTVGTPSRASLVRSPTPAPRTSRTRMWTGGTAAAVESGKMRFAPLGARRSGECNPGVDCRPRCDPPERRCAGALTLTSGLQVTRDIAFTDQHTYPSAGTYYATVTVTDQSGATVIQTVREIWSPTRHPS